MSSDRKIDGVSNALAVLGIFVAVVYVLPGLKGVFTSSIGSLLVHPPMTGGANRFVSVYVASPLLTFGSMFLLTLVFSMLPGIRPRIVFLGAIAATVLRHIALFRAFNDFTGAPDLGYGWLFDDIGLVVGALLPFVIVNLAGGSALRGIDKPRRMAVALIATAVTYSALLQFYDYYAFEYLPSKLDDMAKSARVRSLSQ